MKKVLPPGEILDALVAEQIMEFRWCDSYHGWVGGCGGQGKSWHPSRSTSDAMAVAKVLIDKHKEFPPSSFDGSVFKVDYSNSGWNVGFWIRARNYDNKTEEYEFSGWNGKAKADTLPHAICLAALKAVGIPLDTKVKRFNET